MNHRWDAGGYCDCGARMIAEGTKGKHRILQRLYWNARGEYQGTKAPECTRKPRATHKATQLALFGKETKP